MERGALPYVDAIVWYVAILLCNTADYARHAWVILGDLQRWHNGTDVGDTHCVAAIYAMERVY